MTRELIAAYTPSTSPYPPFINVSRDGDDVTITVRDPAGPGEFSKEDCGKTGSLKVSGAVWDGFMAELLKRIDPG